MRRENIVPGFDINNASGFQRERHSVLAPGCEWRRQKEKKPFAGLVRLLPLLEQNMDACAWGSSLFVCVTR